MYKHNIIELFKTFTPEEINKFSKFLNSSYFNGSKKIIKLYDAIIRYYPAFDQTELTKQSLSLITSPGNFNESTLRDSLSALLKLAERFLTIESFEKDNMNKNIFLLNDLLIRNQDKLFTKLFKNINEQNNNNIKIDSKFYYDNYCLNSNKFNFTLINSKVLHKPEASELIYNISVLSNNLCKFFVMEVINACLNTNTLARKYNIDSNNNSFSDLTEKFNLEELLEYLIQHDNEPVIKMYDNLLKMFLNEEDDTLYRDYKKSIKESLHLLTSDEINFHYYNLLNYCIIKLRSEVDLHYESELHSLYVEILSNQYYKSKNMEYLSVELFRDILIHGLRTKKFDWVKEFIARYSDQVPPNDKDNILNYSYTHYYFSIGNYLKSLEYYGKIIMDSFVYKYDIKNLVLKLYYELNYSEEALCEIRSYREFLRNNPMVPEIRKKRIGNFLKYSEKLINMELENDIEQIEYTSMKLHRDKEVSYKNWLIEKYNQLQTNIKR